MTRLLRAVTAALLAAFVLAAPCLSAPHTTALATPPNSGTAHWTPRDLSVAQLDSFRQMISLQGKPIAAWISGGQAGDAPPAATTQTAARVARAYLSLYLATDNVALLNKAKEALDFLTAMEGAEGVFGYGVTAAGTPVPGPPSPFWVTRWSADACWALALGARVFGGRDPASAKRWRESAVRVLSRTAAELDQRGGPNRTTMVHGRTVPAYLPGGSGEITAMLILALCDLHQHQAAPENDRLAANLCDMLSQFRAGTAQDYPFGAHLESLAWPERWRAERARAVQALATAGRVFNQSRWVEAAAAEANNFLVHVVTGYGLMYSLDPHPRLFPQTPDQVEALVSDFTALYQTTGLPLYARLAGVTAAWLFGNNARHQPLYDPRSGRAADGMSASGPSAGAGAAAAAEAMTATLAVLGTPGENFLSARDAAMQGPVVLEAESGRPVFEPFSLWDLPLDPDTNDKASLVVLKPNSTFWIRFEIPRDDTYIMYLVFLRQPGLGAGVAASVRVDGYTIYQVDMGGAPDLPFLTTDRIDAEFPLTSGVHSVGVRFSGLNFRYPGYVDSVIMQPVVDQRLVVTPAGQALLLLKNMTGQDRTVPALAGDRPPAKAVWTEYAASGAVRVSRSMTWPAGDAGPQVTVPAGATATLEWEAPQ